MVDGILSRIVVVVEVIDPPPSPPRGEVIEVILRQVGVVVD